MGRISSDPLDRPDVVCQACLYNAIDFHALTRLLLFALRRSPTSKLQQADVCR